MHAKRAGKKVFVGMSGGVDSSVSAALLKERGYDVQGVFIKVWHPPFLECDWRKERHDAMRVCAVLDIPFMTLDLEQEYKRDVVDYMIAEYTNGRTPNPDVMCNATIKFGAFFDFARREGADYVATGHYARIESLDSIRAVTGSKSKVTTYQLCAGNDRKKDQSYFLWRLTQEHLAHVLFPIGGYEKRDVRKLAENFGLPTATKKDSQGVCFLGKLDMREFLKRFIEATPGDVLNEKGEVVGTHEGALFYTMGQRHGFRITTQTPDAHPHYVVDKNIATNTITVAARESDSFDNFARKDVVLAEINWISGTLPNTEKKYSARFRYRQTLQACTIVTNQKDTHIVFDAAQSGVASGQSLVLYDGDMCLGGGVIV